MINEGQLYQLIYHSTAVAGRVISIYNSTLHNEMEKGEINNRARICHFLAQILHESGELRYTEELASGEEYEDRADLGNNRPGDGVRFKGRGLIQLTGRANYRAYSYFTGQNFLDNPKAISELPHSVGVAVWYWTTRRLNSLADAGDFEGITRAINGGLNGMENRWRYLNRLMTYWDKHKYG